MALGGGVPGQDILHGFDFARQMVQHFSVSSVRIAEFH